MNEAAIKAAAEAYVAAGGESELPAIFLAMFRVAVGEVVTEADELIDAQVSPEPASEAEPAEPAAPAKKPAKPKK